MRTLSDLQKRILKEEYPNISFESDIDVERYFELRQAGRQGDALGVYNSKLVRKYPNEAQRTQLLRFYRSHDPHYHTLYQESLAELADRILSRTSKIIELLTRDIDTVNMHDAYAVIKLAEGLLSIISPERYEAIAFTERYARYAKSLNIKPVQMQKTAELIRLYVTDTLESVQEFRKETEERRKEHVRREQVQKRQKPVFDLSKIQFSERDIAKIVIPSGISKTEDMVIAYCLRYWNLVNDMAFEKTIFLYSRKFHTKHSDVFQAIKNGRDHGWKDEEILNAVLATVVTGYYYSISGDKYLQRMWAQYSQNMTPAVAVAPRPMPDPATSSTSLPAPAQMPKRVAAAGSATAKTKSQRRSAMKNTEPVTKAKKTTISTKNKTLKPAKTVTPFKAQSPIAGGKKPVIPPAPKFVANSVADIIRKMTGKTYTVYKELFFRSVRPSIRTVLASSSARKNDLFGNRQNDAEDLVYHFLFEHYNDPYQNWKESNTKKQVESLGYTMPTIEPIIENWIRKTNDRGNSVTG
jgi:hypothetical protein